MDEVQIFSNSDFGEIRTVMIDGEPWFTAKDVAQALGYKNTNQSVKDNTNEEDRRVSPVMTPSGTQKMVVVNESGLYTLIFGSTLESAKKFKKWVTSEVLPSIRKTGGYKAPMTIPEQIQLLALGNVELNKRVDTLEDRFLKFEDDLPLFQRDTKEVQNAVKKKALELLGGKESNAYQDKSTRCSVFADIQTELRRNFGVRRYEEIRHKRIDDAIRVVENYEMPLVLMERVRDTNAQQTMFGGDGE